MRKTTNPALTKDVHVLHSHAPHITTPDVLLKKIVVPGARAARLWSEASFISRTHTFDEVIVHCGTNYLMDPAANDNFITKELCTLIRGFQDLFTFQVTFSQIPPVAHQTNRPRIAVVSPSLLTPASNYSEPTF